MKKIFLFTLAILISVTAFAFGGGGGGRVSSQYKRGVSSYGIHFGGEGQVDIDIRDCDEDTETLVDRLCCPNAHLAINGDTLTCCEAGYMPKGEANAQICCHPDEVNKNGACAQPDCKPCEVRNGEGQCVPKECGVCQECNESNGNCVPDTSLNDESCVQYGQTGICWNGGCYKNPCDGFVPQDCEKRCEVHMGTKFIVQYTEAENHACTLDDETTGRCNDFGRCEPLPPDDPCAGVSCANECEMCVNGTCEPKENNTYVCTVDNQQGICMNGTCTKIDTYQCPSEYNLETKPAESVYKSLSCTDKDKTRWMITGCVASGYTLNEQGQCVEVDTYTCPASYTLTQKPNEAVYTYLDCADKNGIKYMITGCAVTGYALNEQQECVAIPEYICDSAYNVTEEEKLEHHIYASCTDKNGTHYQRIGCESGYEWKDEEHTECVAIVPQDPCDGIPTVALCPTCCITCENNMTTIHGGQPCKTSVDKESPDGLCDNAGVCQEQPTDLCAGKDYGDSCQMCDPDTGNTINKPTGSLCKDSDKAGLCNYEGNCETTAVNLCDSDCGQCGICYEESCWIQASKECTLEEGHTDYASETGKCNALGVCEPQCVKNHILDAATNKCVCAEGEAENTEGVCEKICKGTVCGSECCTDTQECYYDSLRVGFCWTPCTNCGDGFCSIGWRSCQILPQFSGNRIFSARAGNDTEEIYVADQNEICSKYNLVEFAPTCYDDRGNLLTTFDEFQAYLDDDFKYCYESNGATVRTFGNDSAQYNPFKNVNLPSFSSIVSDDQQKVVVYGTDGSLHIQGTRNGEWGYYRCVQSATTQCPAGTYWDLNETDLPKRCKTCPDGTYSEAGWFSCETCASGQKASPDHTTCVACDSNGTVCGEGTSAICCAEGETCSVYGTTPTCRVCPECKIEDGKYCSTATPTSISYNCQNIPSIEGKRTVAGTGLMGESYAAFETMCDYYGGLTLHKPACYNGTTLLQSYDDFKAYLAAGGTQCLNIDGTPNRESAQVTRGTVYTHHTIFKDSTHAITIGITSHVDSLIADVSQDTIDSFALVCSQPEDRKCAAGEYWNLDKSKGAFGCRPCEDGTYSEAGWFSCETCVGGKRVKEDKTGCIDECPETGTACGDMCCAAGESCEEIASSKICVPHDCTCNEGSVCMVDGGVGKCKPVSVAQVERDVAGITTTERIEVVGDNSTVVSTEVKKLCDMYNLVPYRLLCQSDANSPEKVEYTGLLNSAVNCYNRDELPHFTVHLENPLYHHTDSNNDYTCLCKWNGTQMTEECTAKKLTLVAGCSDPEPCPAGQYRDLNVKNSAGGYDCVAVTGEREYSESGWFEPATCPAGQKANDTHTGCESCESSTESGTCGCATGKYPDGFGKCVGCSSKTPDSCYTCNETSGTWEANTSVAGISGRACTSDTVTSGVCNADHVCACPQNQALGDKACCAPGVECLRGKTGIKEVCAIAKPDATTCDDTSIWSEVYGECLLTLFQTSSRPELAQFQSKSRHDYINGGGAPFSYASIKSFVESYGLKLMSVNDLDCHEKLTEAGVKKLDTDEKIVQYIADKGSNAICYQSDGGTKYLKYDGTDHMVLTDIADDATGQRVILGDGWSDFRLFDSSRQWPRAWVVDKHPCDPGQYRAITSPSIVNGKTAYECVNCTGEREYSEAGWFKCLECPAGTKVKTNAEGKHIGCEPCAAGGEVASCGCGANMYPDGYGNCVGCAEGSDQCHTCTKSGSTYSWEPISGVACKTSLGSAGTCNNGYCTNACTDAEGNSLVFEKTCYQSCQNGTLVPSASTKVCTRRYTPSYGGDQDTNDHCDGMGRCLACGGNYDCEDDEYCKILTMHTGYSDSWSGYNPYWTQSRCVQAPNLNDPNNSVNPVYYGEVARFGELYYYNAEQLDYRSALNYCLSMGKHMISYANEGPVSTVQEIANTVGGAVWIRAVNGRLQIVSENGGITPCNDTTCRSTRTAYVVCTSAADPSTWYWPGS